MDEKWDWDMALTRAHNRTKDESEKFFYSSMWWGLHGMKETS